MKLKFSNRKNVIAGAIFTLVAFFTLNNANAATHTISTNTNLSAFGASVNNNDTVMVTATLSVNTNRTYSATGIKWIVNGGLMAWTGNNTLTLGTGSQIILQNGGLFSTAAPCNAVKVLTVGVTTATCNGGGAGSLSFSDINNAGGLGAISLLPVNLLSFESQVSNSDVIINWQTAQETNNSHFIVFRSQSGENWEQLATINGIGNSFEINNYSYTDLTPFAVNYYKLVQVDFDGTETNLGTKMVLAKNEEPKLSTPVIFPNPVENKLNVRIENSGSTQVKVELMSASGQVLSENTNEANESDVISIDTDNLATGVYLVRITLNNKVYTQRILKK